jgi:hypothetical protein
MQGETRFSPEDYKTGMKVTAVSSGGDGEDFRRRDGHGRTDVPLSEGDVREFEHG